MRLGLLAAARITTSAVVDPARLVEGVAITAVAARSLDRARASADEWGVETAYGSYDELVNDPDIDAVYVATPAALHHRWTMAALAAGKDVLCEKPLAANADEAREMVDAAADADLVLMEGYHWRYHPMIEQIGGLLADGRLGDIRHVDAAFDLPAGHIPRDDIRWDLALGGGALMDLGCYPLQWVRWAIGGEPEVVSAEADCPVPDIDARFTAELRWPGTDGSDGTAGAGEARTGTISCSMIADGPTDIHLSIVGTDGELHVTNPLAPQHGARLELRSGGTSVDIAPVGLDTTTYQHQLAAFVHAVRTRTAPATGGDDSVATMQLIDACYRAAGLSPRPSLSAT